MIDARITKVMARLVTYKEFKNIYGMKSLPCPSNGGHVENTSRNHCENKEYTTREGIFLKQEWPHLPRVAV